MRTTPRHRPPARAAPSAEEVGHNFGEGGLVEFLRVLARERLSVSEANRHPGSESS
jgi:hypothetical protein